MIAIGIGVGKDDEPLVSPEGMTRVSRQGQIVSRQGQIARQVAGIGDIVVALLRPRDELAIDADQRAVAVAD